MPSLSISATRSRSSGPLASRSGRVRQTAPPASSPSHSCGVAARGSCVSELAADCVDDGAGCACTSGAPASCGRNGRALTDTSDGSPSQSQHAAPASPSTGPSASGGCLRPWSTSTMLPRATVTSCRYSQAGALPIVDRHIVKGRASSRPQAMRTTGVGRVWGISPPPNAIGYSASSSGVAAVRRTAQRRRGSASAGRPVRAPRTSANTSTSPTCRSSARPPSDRHASRRVAWVAPAARQHERWPQP